MRAMLLTRTGTGESAARGISFFLTGGCCSTGQLA
jgi:hypothetical protein